MSIRNAGEIVESQWQPIETAPKTGERILIAHGNSVWEDEWWGDDDGYWFECSQSGPHWGEAPTHWMPLPDPPENLS